VGTAENAVEIRNVTKRFPGVVASNGANLCVRRGEIHALLGENGAGKSTLMNMLTGLIRPDSGEILINGERVSMRSPADAIALGIGMVHQHFRLVQTFTVAENITLGMPTPRFRLDMAPIEREVSEFSARYGLEVNPRAKVWQLSVGEQQRVEIIKMLYRGVRVLILDEPTAVLTPNEVKELFDTMRRMAAAGETLVFISHKLDEVMSISDRVTVLRAGKDVFTTDTASTNVRELASKMVGRELAPPPERPRGVFGRPVLEVDGLKALGDRGEMALKGLSLTVREGEIHGIAGVAGNGQRELAETITGLRRALEGKVVINGKDYTNRRPRAIIEAGVSHIPEDRLGMGLAGNLPLTDNAIMKDYREDEIGPGMVIDSGRATAWTRDLVSRFQVKAPTLRTPVRLLSGGNSQKLLLAREATHDHNVVVAVHPTRGLDVGATEAVHDVLLAQRSSGVGILLISEDLEELIVLCDRISVMFEGKIIGSLEREDVDIDRIGLMMAGIDPQGAAHGKGADQVEAGV
jgi:ABC-type uncharacterized transport system ATPase subunit